MKIVFFISFCTMAVSGICCFGGDVPVNLHEKPSVEESSEIDGLNTLKIENSPIAEDEEQNDSAEAPAFLEQEAEQIKAKFQAEDDNARNEVNQFIETNGIKLENYNVQAKAASKNNNPAPAKSGSSSITMNDMDVACDGYLYLDSEKGFFVYNKNVKARHPEFSMDCDKELKIYLYMDEKKAAKKNKNKAKDKEKSSSALPGSDMKMNYNAIKKIVAEGNVIAKGVDKKGNKFDGRAEHITFDLVTEEMLMTGGYPSLEDAKNKVQCVEPGGFIRMKDGKVYIHGKTKTKIKDLNLEKDGLSKGSKKK